MKPIAIYGYNFTKEVTFDGGVLTPIFTSAKELNENKCEGTNYILTGFFTPSPKYYAEIPHTLFDLTAVLSFIEQKNVIIGGSLEENESPTNYGSSLPRKLNAQRKKGPGKIILEDYFFPQSRAIFIALAMRKLAENVKSDQNPFRTAFYKSMVSFRESMSYVDVDYFLNFSALESLCRYIQKDFKPGRSPQILSSALKEYGFDVSKDGNPVKQRNMMHYCKLRNSLFHNGEYIAFTQDSKPESIIYLKDYSSNLKLLLPLVLMKYINFDDESINWDSWIDHEPFISLRPRKMNPPMQQQSV